MYKSELERVRKDRGLTAKQLATAVGVDIKSIFNYESGLSTPRLGTAIGIARVLGVSVESLWGGISNVNQ